MKTIELPCYGFKIILSDDGDGVSVKSRLSSKVDDEAFTQSPMDFVPQESLDEYNFYVNAIESLVMAHACAGVDIESPAYLEGIETAVEAIANKL
jgi:hypothetical protein|tara:strand:- start:125 stop:409 length:285 start_codon:yes stop_codon:yes gene_type:complete